MDKIAVLMSGGVDSSVACALLKEKGHDIIGITGIFYKSETSNACQENIDLAKKIAIQYGFKHHCFDLQELFKKNVIDYFLDNYLSGKTPNPCIKCNESVKISALSQKALELGFEYFATGHFTQILRCSKTDRYFFRANFDNPKDQSYFLFALNQNILSRLKLPLQGLNKSMVRDIASKLNLPTKDKAESQEICFIENNKYKDFMISKLNLKKQPGLILNNSGKTLGRHKGTWGYTVGQRKGLGLSSKNPLYVIKINPQNNTIIVGNNDDLMKDNFKIENINFMKLDKISENETYFVKVRSTATPLPCKVYESTPNELEISLEKRERAITPGQAAVFFNKDGDLLFGGWIK